MNSANSHSKILIISIIAFLLIVISGCKPGQTTPETIAPTQPPTAAVTPEPTAPTQKLILVDPSGTTSAEITTFLTDFAVSNGLDFETSAVDALPVPGEETRIVIYLSEPENLQSIVSSAPQTQFIVAGSADPAGVNNLSVIKSQPQDLAFMGGYLTTLIAWDWRSGGLIANDTALGAGYLDAFENGGRYVCGQCTPYYAPYYYFPLVLEESSTAGAGGWLAQVNSLNEYYVDTVFVDPSAALPEVLDALATGEYTLIGNAGTPMPERFTALLDYDLLPGLSQLLPQALNGSGGQVIGAQVKIASFTNSKLITPGKIDLFNKSAGNLATGWVSPFSIP